MAIQRAQFVENPRYSKKGNEDDGHHRLPDPGLEQEIAVTFQPNASLEESIECVALPTETVDDVRAGLD